MVQLPVWELGLVIFIPQTVAFLLRPWLEKIYVVVDEPINQSLRQFRLELALYFAAGMAMAFILLFGYGFPLVQSGMKLVLGVFTVGMFAALDLALARERRVIKDSLSGTGLYTPPQRLSPLTKRFSVVATLVLLLITAIILLVLIRDVSWLAEQGLSMESFNTLSKSVLLDILFVMGFLIIMVINLVFSYARNLRILFNNETEVLELVSNGDLSRQVPVVTSDEMGVIAGHTNTMIASLRDGVRMREGLRIAKEVQQHFLPEVPPELHGLELAGRASFSDETGGDFYDFIPCEDEGCGKLTVAVGDVSGHGIGAALLMSAGRAMVRQSVNLSSSLARNIAIANTHLSRDIDSTGRFITLFAISLDPDSGTATWVNAGHQPPVLYDIESGTFTELRGGDIPMGVVSAWEFHENTMALLGPGQILLIGTDGIWEAHDSRGDMYGNTRLQKILSDNATKSAEEIVDAIVVSVNGFANNNQEDDVTLVVVKGVEKS